MMFRVGMKVECVDASVSWGHPTGSELEEGRIYEVRAVGLATSGALGLRLHEVVLSSEPGHIGNISGQPFVDAFYRASRFRPVVSRKTDISLLTAMLTPSKQEIDA